MKMTLEFTHEDAQKRPSINRLLSSAFNSTESPAPVKYLGRDWLLESLGFEDEGWEHVGYGGQVGKRVLLERVYKAVLTTRDGYK